MTDEQFAKACEIVEKFATNNSHLIAHRGSDAEHVMAVVRMARSLRYKHPKEAAQTERP